MHRLFLKNLVGGTTFESKLKKLLMLRNAPTPILVTTGYLFACLVLLVIEVTRGFATVMLYILPAVIFWMAWSVIMYGKSIAKRLKDDEFGYGG